MWTCSYCGRANEDNLPYCSGCGCEFVNPSGSSTLKSSRRFFNWITTTILLLFVGAVSVFFTLLDVWLVVLGAQGTLPDKYMGYSLSTRVLIRGVVENAAIAVFCLLAWYLMLQRTRSTLLTGVLLVMSALFLSVRRWIIWDLPSAGPIKYAEPLLFWSCFVYVIIYAYRERRIATV
jgi:hypothetical protein